MMDGSVMMNGSVKGENAGMAIATASIINQWCPDKKKEVGNRLRFPTNGYFEFAEQNSHE